MRAGYYTKVELRWDDAIQRYVLYRSEGDEEYSGSFDLAKKGRGTVEDAAKTQGQIASTNQGLQASARAAADPYASSLMATAPGQLSPRALANYESNVRNIHDTYGQNTRNGFRALAYSGFGGAPSGMEASMENTANRNAAEDEINAYVNAQNETGQEGLQGMNYYQNAQSIYNPLPATQAQAQSGYMRSQMGSTLGDIGTGLTTAAGMFNGVGMGGGRNGFGIWG